MTAIRSQATAQWAIYPYGRGFVVMRGNCGEALSREAAVQYDASRRDCFFATENEALAAIAKAENTLSPATAIRKLLSTMTADNQIADAEAWLGAMEGLRASVVQDGSAA